MDTLETFYAVALTRVSGINLANLLQLYRRLGSATAVMEHRNDIRDVMPEASPMLVSALKDTDEAMKRAEEELKYDAAHGIEALCMSDPRYPQRLLQCDDAPLVVYYRGRADLNPRHVVCMVGTRQCTVYGQDLVRRFCTDLQRLCPDALIISGLAYGIDIAAHRQALAHGFNTVAVLAHGLDSLYPSMHRETADKMVSQGGLLTEFITQTRPDKRNFVQRNRIVAGMSDACIVVESGSKGGSLITAGISRSYDREVFAFPGAVNWPQSEGCNQLIRNNEAALITSAADFVTAMGWDDDLRLSDARQKGIERNLFPTLSADEQAIADVLRKHNDLQVNMLSAQSGLPIARLTALLFEMEMKGIVKTLAGGAYHLLE